jgi:hypothetical protein
MTPSDALSKSYWDAHDEGHQAYLHRRRQVENPYRGVDENKAAGWDEGWLLARQADEDEDRS